MENIILDVIVCRLVSLIKNLSSNKLKKIISFTPSQSLILKHEISSTINFLLSKDSHGINGQEIIVDGGISSNGGFGD